MRSTETQASTLKPSEPRPFTARAGSWLSYWALRIRLQPPILCPHCGYNVAPGALYRRLRVCDRCGFHWPCSVRMRIHALVDPHSFSPFGRVIAAATRGRGRPVPWASGIGRPREPVVTGTAKIGGVRVALVLFDFEVMGGTMSTAVGEAVTRAFERAAANKLPLIAIISSGGVRIQEGTPALLQMAKTTLAVEQFSKVGKLFISILAHPTTGGVYASFTSLADVLIAEPNAVIGFAGPRVSEAATGRKLPPDSHSAETLYKHGLVDAVIPRQEQREWIARILRSAEGPALFAGAAKAKDARTAGVQASPLFHSAQSQTKDEDEVRLAWETVKEARRITRPTSLDYISRVFTGFVELHGDRTQGDDERIVAGLARFEGSGCVVIGEQRARDEENRGAGPAGYRKAERLIHLAGRLGLPIVTLIDTPGADPSLESEQGGVAGAIARCLSAFVTVPVPTVSVIIGEGTSGGALALAAADRVLMLEDATFSVISPEGASTILYGDASHAPEMAEMLGLSAEHDLLPQGIVDQIIPVRAAETISSPDEMVSRVSRAISENMRDLLATDPQKRLDLRHRRYRNNGRNGAGT